MLRRPLPNSGPARTQHIKAQQKEQAQADARELEAKASKVRVAANTKRVAAHLLSGLGTQLDRYGARAPGGPGPGAELTAGWTVEFDLARVSGDPEGVQRGQRVNSKDRSVAYVTPDGRRFGSREAIAKHFGLEAPEEESRPADKNGKPKKLKPEPPPYEPPPVQTESGQLAFEVERVLDVRHVDLHMHPDTTTCACTGNGCIARHQPSPPTPGPHAGAAAQARRAGVPRTVRSHGQRPGVHPHTSQCTLVHLRATQCTSFQPSCTLLSALLHPPALS